MGDPTTKLRGVTCHMGSHSDATWHKWMRPALTPANEAGTRFTYPAMDFKYDTHVSRDSPDMTP